MESNELVKLDSLQERLENYYAGNGKLTEKDKTIVERMELAFGFLSKYRNKVTAANMLVKVMERRGPEESITMRTAYRDLDLAEKIILPFHKVSKDVHRLMVINSALRDIRRVEKKIRLWSNHKNNPISAKELATLLKVKDLAERRIIEAAGLKDNSELPDFSNLEPHKYEVKLPEEMVAMLSQIMSRGAVDVTALQKFVQQSAEDIDFEE